MSAALLRRFGVSDGDLIGRGGQSSVYALDADRVLRVYNAENDPAFPPALAAFYAALEVPPLPFAIPRIRETGADGGVSYAVEDRLPGTPLASAFPALGDAGRARAVRGFMEAAAALRRIRHPQAEFGELLRQGPVRSDSWPDFLWRKGVQRARDNAAWLRADVPQLDRALERYRVLTAALPPPEPALVHCDYYGANVLVAPDGAVTAVIDFSPLSLIGDGRLDVVGAFGSLEQFDGIAPAARAEAHEFLIADLGADWRRIFVCYRAYLALLHSGAREQVPALYRWCVRNLNELAES